MIDLRAEIRFKNAVLWNALQDQFGRLADAKKTYRRGSILRTASEVVGVHLSMIGGFLNLTINPRYRNGEPKPVAEKLARELDIEFGELFPPTLYALKLPRVLVREFESPQILSLQEARQELRLLAAPDADMVGANTALDHDRIISEALKGLSPKQEKVMRLRFGLMEDERERSLSEIGEEFDVSKERIRQIEARAIRDLLKNRKFRSLGMQYVKGTP